MDADLRARSLPLSKPLGTAAGRIEDRRVFVLRIERDGVVGIGEAAPLPGWTESTETCRERLRDAVDALEGDRAREATECVEGAPAASHALELAIADRAAREAGQPLAEYLGDAWTRDSVTVNATVGDGSVAATAAAAERAVAAGFETVKVKVGARSVPEDGRRIRSVREAVGDDVAVRADANGAWDRAAAERILPALREAGVSYVEQPLPADDLAGLRSLRGAGVGIAVDETLRETSVSAVVEADAADAAVVKPMVQGGPRAAVEAARRARNNGVDPVLTTTIDGAVARTAAVHCAAAVPVDLACGLATGALLESDLGPDPAPVEDGVIAVPEGPGIAGEDVVNAWWSA